MKNRMLKLLLLLAAVAALAVAAPLAAPDFNDLDDSDLDDSDLDASDLDASDLDASDLDGTDADNLLQGQEMTRDGLLPCQNGVVQSLDGGCDTPQDSVGPSQPWSDLNPLQKAQQCYEYELTCKINEFIDPSNGVASCTPCPEGQTQPYGDFEACGSGLCSSCPLKIDPSAKLCVTDYAEKVMKGQVADKANQASLTQPETENLQTNPFIQKAMSKPEEGGVKFAVVAEEIQLVQMSSCETGLTCCLPGYYGTSSSSCTECPSNKPSSPYSAPNSACQCPNSASNKCFACTNKCKPYDSQSRTCLPVQCPGLKTCRTVNSVATCV
jgi:hypothetical protein